MAYNKTTWVDNSTPAVDAAHLNNIENGIVALDVRLGEAESDIVVNANAVASQASTISEHTTAIATLNATLGTAIILRGGTYTGTWSPTLDATFGISNYSDYNWKVEVHQTSYVIQNGQTVTLNGYVDADEKTLRFTSAINSTPVAARYSLTGVKKSISSKATLNQ